MNVRFSTAFAVFLLLIAIASAPASAQAPAGVPEAGPAPAGVPEAGPAPAATVVTPAPAVPEPSASADVTRSGPAAPAPVAIDTSKDYRIGPEDVLDVLVWKQSELSRTVPVRPDGKISLPLVNDIVASGFTTNELRALITERLEPFIQSPEVSVIVKEVHSFKVSVHGNVNMPNQYEIRSEATVLELISRAQGFNQYADKKNVTVLRRNGQTMKVNWERVKDGKDPNLLVEPGDVIIVN